MPAIKLVTETELLTEAFGWSDEAPRWFADTQEPETLADFLETSGEKLFYGIWDDEFTALIRLNPVATGIYSIDLFAKRTTNMDVLKQGGYSLQQYLFDKGAVKFLGWIPFHNRGIRKLYHALGFEHHGMKCYKQSSHGRPIKWLLMTNVNKKIVLPKVTV